MTVHTIPLTLNHLHGRFSRDILPVLSISTGDTVRFQTLDAGWCDFEQSNPFEKQTKFAGRNRELDSGHALCGPIAIEGARVGMTLEIRLKTIRTGAWGWSTGGGWSSEWNARLGVADLPEWLMRWRLDQGAGITVNQYGQNIAMCPFMGILGMPPQKRGTILLIRPDFVEETLIVKSWSKA